MPPTALHVWDIYSQQSEQMHIKILLILYLNVHILIPKYIKVAIAIFNFRYLCFLNKLP